MLQTVLPAAGGEEHSILLPELSEVVWSLIVLVILFAVVMKLIYPRYVEIMNERTTKIQGGLEQAQEAEKQIKDADVAAAQTLRAAQEEAAQIRDEAQQTAKSIVAEARERATKEADRIALNAQRQLESDRQAAEVSLRTDVGLLASELAENIVGEQLKDRELSARVVDRFLDQLETNIETESVKS